MRFDIVQVNYGKDEGATRCKKYIEGFEAKSEDLEQVTSFISQILQGEPTEWDARAVQLFSEVVTVAWLSRAYFKEPQLEKDEASSFLKVLGKLLDSFVHRKSR